VQSEMTAIKVSRLRTGFWEIFNLNRHPTINYPLRAINVKPAVYRRS